MSTMNIYTKPGQKVYFLGKNGYDAELEFASHEAFYIGEELTVKNIDVGSSISYVEFVEFPNRKFNTVMFDNVESKILLFDIDK